MAFFISSSNIAYLSIKTQAGVERETKEMLFHLFYNRNVAIILRYPIKNRPFCPDGFLDSGSGPEIGWK